MNLIHRLFKHFEDAAAARERAEQEAFLAEAVDIHDVEARLRAWERRHHAATPTYPAQHGELLH